MPKSLIEKDVCDSCDHDIISHGFQTTAQCVFIGCKHTFHKHCLNVYYKETEADRDIAHMRCPKCAKDKIDLTLEQIMDPPKALKAQRAIRRSTV